MQVGFFGWCGGGLFIIILVCWLFRGWLGNRGSWREPHESALAELSRTEVAEETIRKWEARRSRAFGRFSWGPFWGKAGFLRGGGGEIFIIIPGCWLFRGWLGNRGSWGEPHESAFAELSYTKVGEETSTKWYGFLRCLYNTFKSLYRVYTILLTAFTRSI